MMLEQLHNIIKEPGSLERLHVASSRLRRHLFDPPRKRQPRTLSQLTGFVGGAQCLS